MILNLGSVIFFNEAWELRLHRAESGHLSSESLKLATRQTLTHSPCLRGNMSSAVRRLKPVTSRQRQIKKMSVFSGGAKFIRDVVAYALSVYAKASESPPRRRLIKSRAASKISLARKKNNPLQSGLGFVSLSFRARMIICSATLIFRRTRARSLTPRLCNS